MHISILGGGSWGTALAIHLAKNHHTITIWEFFETQARKVQDERICPLLPEVPLPQSMSVYSDMHKALAGAELILLVVPSDKVESTIQQAKSLIQNQPIIICSKGFASSGQLLGDVVQKQVSGNVYCLYGPTHAEEVCKGILSGIVLAGGEGKEKLKKVLESKTLKVDLSDDIIGVQVAAALKNILAVFIGVLDGAKLGDNTKAYVLTKGVEEIKNIGVKWGARTDTFYGLAGIGDVYVTCTSTHSRNHYVGEEVGKGRKLDEVLGEMKMVAEGITSVKQIPHLQKQFNLALPLMNGLYQILFEGAAVERILEGL